MSDGAESKTLTEALALQVRSSNYTRFSELYARVAPAIFAWGSLRIPKSVIAYLSPEDLVQEVWARALLRLAQFDPEKGKFRYWTFGFARRVLYEAIRGVSSRQVQAQGANSGLLLVEGLPAEATQISQRASRNEQAQLLVSRIKELPEDDQKLILMRGLEGLDHDEIAAEFQVDAAAIRKRWQRLKERLDEAQVFQEFLA